MTDIQIQVEVGFPARRIYDDVGVHSNLPHSYIPRYVTRPQTRSYVGKVIQLYVYTRT
jgi:hypothetical protein